MDGCPEIFARYGVVLFLTAVHSNDFTKAQQACAACVVGMIDHDDGRSRVSWNGGTPQWIV
jgi:hypothetical protein